MISVEDGVRETDFERVLHGLRPEERDDFINAWGSARKALKGSIDASIVVKTAFLEGRPVGIFGVAPTDPAAPWLALTVQAERNPIEIARGFRDWAKIFLRVFEELENTVPVEDKKAIKLLKLAGFTVDDDELTDGKRTVRRFYAQKGDI